MGLGDRKREWKGVGQGGYRRGGGLKAQGMQQ